MYPQVFGKYVLERELARGGMARVMLATLRGAGGFEKRLVVKQIRDELACDDDFVARFVEEAKTAVALAHPNIVPVYELGVELGTYFLAMELVEGASLSELLRASAPAGLSPEEGAYVGVEVCRALDYAHRRMNVVHRDITPRNVMVDEEGHVKVIDFGIAAPVATTPAGHGVFGSPGHMPPEQMEGRELTAAADVFAVAVLLMEVWGNSPLFRRKTNEGIQSAMRAPHPKPSDINIRLLPLDDIVASALSLDPKTRPQQADDLGRVLRRFLAGIDLGDLARQLGDRVRAFRERPPPPRNEPSPVLARPPSRPTGTPIGTRTFALRDVVRAVSESSADLSTRRMTSGAPATDRPRQLARQTTGPVGGTSRRALAWFVAVGGSGAVIASLMANPRPNRIFPPANNPAAAGPGAPNVPAPATVAGATNVGGQGNVAVPAIGAGQGNVAVPANVVGSAMRLNDPTHAGENVAPRQAARTSPASSAPLSASSGGGTGPTSPPANAASAVRSERAHLFLLGDGTQVSIDGVAYGASPQHAAVDPGSHTVVFRFAATGESRSDVLSVGPGEHATLRADFTGATPTIRVER